MASVPNYEPGTVAVATVPNYAEPLIDGYETHEARVSRYSDGWALLSDPDIFWPDHRGQVSNVRPLLVLDLGPDDWPRSLPWVAIWLRDFEELSHGNPDWALRCKMMRRIVEQIEAQTRPPRIPEPGLWGVVEADWNSRNVNGLPRHEWVHVKGGQWKSVISSVLVRWDDLINPSLVREGVEA